MRSVSVGVFFCLLMSLLVGAGLYSEALRTLSGVALVLQVIVLGELCFGARLHGLMARNARLEALNTRLRNIMNALSQVALITADASGRTLLFSAGAEKLFGFKRDEMLGKQHVDILQVPVPGTEHSLGRDTQRSEAAGVDVHTATELTYRRKDGSQFTGELRRAQMLQADDGQVEHIHAIVDVSERIALLKKLNEGKAFLKKLTQRIPNVLYQYHLREKGESYFSYCSPSLEQLFELRPEDIVDIRFSQNPLFERIHPDDLPLLFAATQQSVQTGEPWACDFRVCLPKRGTRWLRGESYAEKQSDGSLVWYGSFIDISELKDREVALHVQAITDELTGIYNRRYFMTHLAREVDQAQRYGSAFSLIVLDLDHFKSINDRWGHEGGDTVLKETCRLIGQRLRSSDVFCRIGGEELAILCPSTQGRQAQSLAESLRQSLASHQIHALGAVTGSFGVACWEAGLDGEALLRQADEATYRAKQQGRNRVQVAFE